MKLGVMDIGTNSVLMLIVNIKNSNNLNIIEDISVITKLGEDMKQGRIEDEKFRRTIDILCSLKERAERYGVDKILAFGTMVLRIARNSQDFIEEVKRRCQLNIEVISPSREAELTFRGVVHEIENHTLITLIDIGGGSTEFIKGKKKRIEKIESIDIGALTLKDKFFSDEPYSINEAIEYVKEKVKPLKTWTRGSLLIGTGGTITTFAAIKHSLDPYDPSIVENTLLSLHEIREITKNLLLMERQERVKVKGLEKGRVDTIIPGGIILSTVMEELNHKEIRVSTRGLRYGVIYEMLEK